MEPIYLPINHVTQMGNRKFNDCGAAVIAMLTGRTTDQVLTETRHPKNMPYHFTDLKNGLRLYGIDSDHNSVANVKADIKTIEQELRMFRPVIALVGYPHLPENFIDYQYAHFILVVGMDDKFMYYHDSLSSDNRGSNVGIKRGQLVEALRDPRWGNQPDQILLIRKSYLPQGGEEPVDEIGLLKKEIDFWREKAKAEKARNELYAERLLSIKQDASNLLERIDTTISDL